jgi:dipeptidyl aminopeptidase/acylaminoacyl peptidase
MLNMNQKQSLPKSKRSRLWRILGISGIILVVLIIAGYLAIGAIAANKLTIAQRLFTDDNPQNYGMSYEDISFPARIDGLKIAAWYIPAVEGQTADKSPAIVMVHGWNASRTNALNHHFLDLAKTLHQAGFSVLMIDLRGHGQSADSHFTFGRLERRDVLAAVDYLLERGHQPGKIGLIGISMGAASVIGAAAEDQAVEAVATDSLFAEIYPVVKGLWVEQSGLPMIFLYPTRWMYYVENGYDLASARPIDEIGKIAPRPLLMINCQKDTYIPIEQFQALKQAAPWAQTWSVQECRHAEIYEFVPQEYNQKIVTFFTEGLM